jgi:hypothetical protein
MMAVPSYVGHNSVGGEVTEIWSGSVLMNGEATVIWSGHDEWSERICAGVGNENDVYCYVGMPIWKPNGV